MTRHTTQIEPEATGVGRWPRLMQWTALLAASIVVLVPLELMGFPAALLLGPMIAGIVLGVSDARLRVPKPLFILAQAVIGCMMARALPPAIFVELVEDWPIYVLGIGSVVVVAAGLGILLARLKVLPGTTAIWGSAPGAAATIVIMADAFGADARLVAFMTYLRVALVALAASLVARFAVPGGAVPPAIDWFPAVAPVPFAQTAALIVVAMIVATLIRMPVGAIFLTMVAGILLQNFAGLQIELPPILLARLVRARRLGHRAEVHARHPAARLAGAAGGGGKHCGPDRGVCRFCVPAGLARGCRSAYGVSGYQPGWRQLGGDHRGQQRRRRALRDGNAGRAPVGRYRYRSLARPLHCDAKMGASPLKRGSHLPQRRHSRERLTSRMDRAHTCEIDS